MKYLPQTMLGVMILFTTITNAMHEINGLCSQSMYTTIEIIRQQLNETTSPKILGNEYHAQTAIAKIQDYYNLLPEVIAVRLATPGALAYLRKYMTENDAAVVKTNLKEHLIDACGAAVEDCAVVECLLDLGISPNIHSKDNPAYATPLDNAASKGHTNVVRLLVSRGALINHVDPDGASALNWACYNNHFLVATWLIGANADVNVRNKHTGKSLLKELIDRQKQDQSTKDIIELLRKSGAHE
jgi:Ankyrin repeats (3 copies)